MKTLAMITLAAMMATSASAHQSYFSDVKAHATSELETAAVRYADALHIDNDGVVASAMAHAVWMKLSRPDLPFTNLRAEINALVNSAPSVDLRYRAHLASLVFDSPGLFKGIELMDLEGDVELFATVAGRVSYSLLEKKEK
jgi:hypothetical protein